MHEEHDPMILPADQLVVRDGELEPDSFNGFEEPAGKIARDATDDHADGSGREPDDDAYIGGPVEVDYDTGQVQPADEGQADTDSRLPLPEDG